MTALCFIGIGSNLDNPLQQVQRAAGLLHAHPALTLHETSPWYGSRAVGPGEQPDFVNGVASLSTALTPRQLLHELQAIEDLQGRVREQRWGPRTLDLDILLYGDRVEESPELTLPHPRLRERPFVLLPLADIAPSLVLPDGTSLRALLDYVGSEDTWPLRSQDTR